MKKISLVLAISLLFCFIMTGCNTESPPSDSSVEVSSSEEVTEPDVSIPPVEHKPITLTEEHIEGMKAYMRDCKYMIFMQSMENGYDGQANYSTTRYSLSMNVEQGAQTMSMRYITVDGINREGVGYKLFSDGSQILASENGVWAEAGEEYASLLLDISGFNNTLDVFEYLLHDIQLPVGVEGLSTGELWTFELTEQADDSLLTGIDYDVLGDAEYKFTFRYADEVVRPDSITVRVNYELGNTAYYVESVIQINSIGNTKIGVPQVGSKA